MKELHKQWTEVALTASRATAHLFTEEVLFFRVWRFQAMFQVSWMDGNWWDDFIDCFLYCVSAFSRPVALGQTCGQLQGSVFVHHQWGQCVHVPLQLGCSSILSHQHRHSETRGWALDDAHPAARARRHGWEQKAGSSGCIHSPTNELVHH